MILSRHRLARYHAAALVAFVALVAVFPTALARKYNTHAEPVDGKINVFITAHTHDDVGWLKTVDEYYMGANNTIQHAGVQFILDSVIPALEANPDRKFIYVEQAFFQRWWREASASLQARVKKLVDNGQLSFANGGWCMHDEAASHFVAMVDQTTLGHRFLKDQFGAVPKTGWQIDPFGHSATQAALLSAEVGFESLWFARIDFQDKEAREADKRMQFMWRPSQSLGPEAEVFTGAFITGYGPPNGFNFDISANGQPIQDDPRLEDVNVKYFVDNFVAWARHDANFSATPNVLFLAGSDFEHENSNEWFKNLDRLIHYVNLDGRVNALYGTPLDFTKRLNAANHTWTVTTNDLFPYADEPHAYWTGYFTSRPALKYYVRKGSGYLQTARQLDLFNGGDGSKLERYSEAMGVVQHHDAVSGTAKQHTTYDYAKRIAWGMTDGEALTNEALGTLATESGTPPNFTQCFLANVSRCDGTSSVPFSVVAYNALPRARTEILRIPVPVDASQLSVVDSSGKALPFQTTPSPADDVSKGGHPFQLLFSASLPSVGFSTFFVNKASSASSRGALPDEPPMTARSLRSEATSISNEFLTLSFDPTTGRLAGAESKTSGLSIKLDQNWHWYNSTACGEHFGYQGKIQQNSGAYIFRPNNSVPGNVASGPVSNSVITGPVMQEVVQTFSPWLSQSVRLYTGQPYAEIEYTVGPIPIEDGFGKEVITRFITDIKSNNISYTDSNGREMQERRLNYRQTWKLNISEPVAGNYYPVNAATFIKDTQAQLSILPDRSQGTASLWDGEIELMVHRRILYDDGRGVGEPLNETQGITPYPNPVRLGKGLVIRGRHWLVLDKPESSASQFRPLMDRLFAEPLLAFAPNPSGSVDGWSKDHALTKTFTDANFPENVQLMTFEAIDSKTVLVRVAHQFGIGEDSVLSQPATVALSSLFTGPMKIASVSEVSLTANQPVSALANRMKWNVDDNTAGVVEGAGMFRDAPAPPTYDVKLGPLQIRTFEVSLA